jgi:hypothetical protein
MTLLDWVKLFITLVMGAAAAIGLFFIVLSVTLASIICGIIEMITT